jgi:hypothetical protein
MSVPFGSNVLTLSAVAKQLRTTFETFTDRRRGKNTHYTLVDAALSAFSVFFMQSPSFLEHQRTMQDTQRKDNAQTLFGVHQVPTDNPIRSLLDAVDPAEVYPMFPYIFRGLAAGWGSRFLPRGEQQRVAHAGRDPLLLLPEDSLPVLLDPATHQRLGDVFPFGVDAGRGQAGL